MATNNFTNFKDGIEIVPKAVSNVSSQGDFDVTSADGKVHYHNGTTSSPLVTESSTATLTNKTIDTGTNTITNITNTNITAGAAIDASKIANGSVSNTEFQYLDGVTSAIQSQLNTISGSAVTALTGDVSATGPGSSATTINSVGGSSAANVHNAELLANAAVSANTASTIVKRDGSGNFSAGTITASLTGNATNVTGVVAIANGGSGQTTANTALNAFLPSQATNSGKVLTSDGTNTSWVTPAATGANTSLSNLTATSINQSLIPDSDNVRTVGSPADRFSNIFSSIMEVVDSSRIGMRLTSPGTIPSGETSAQIQGWDVGGTSQPLAITSLNNGSSNSTATANTFVETGNKTAGTGNSGNIIIQTGTSAGGTRGFITLNGKGLNLNQITTPSNPSASFNKLYFKSDNNLYSLTSGGVETVFSSTAAIRSEVWVYNGNGFGATNTKIRRFSTIGKNIGTDITYADSATLGATFTINTTGIYAIDHTDSTNDNGSVYGISLNSSQLTTTFSTINDSDKVSSMEQPASAGAVPMITSCSATLNLTAGDVIRAHSSAAGSFATNYQAKFRITKINN